VVFVSVLWWDPEDGLEDRRHRGRDLSYDSAFYEPDSDEESEVSEESSQSSHAHSAVEASVSASLEASQEDVDASAQRQDAERAHWQAEQDCEQEQIMKPFYLYKPQAAKITVSVR
jgi:hypothetical protein